ncbi:MAG: formylmethanofuran dehydrogenase subunit A [Candidatus Jordarchaeum sp.]|uniref:formylmethanofuran dehydrogenase subunit A n=1 Tax=Candidatus Jordarchaeum sp. TaxID=2823881 RepID=UPI0040499E77
MTELLIKNGYVYDPFNKIDGEKISIAIKDGKIVEESKLSKKAQTIDASGMVVMPGGVDIHTHIAGAKVNTGRILRPEDHRKDVVPKAPGLRSGTGYSVPTTFITGYRYAQMGYTTAFEPATPPLKTRHTHEELNDIPILDKACFPLFGNNWFVFDYIVNRELDKLVAFVAWLLRATKGYAVKIVNPGGDENWAWGKNVNSLDDPVTYFELSPRDIIEGLAYANEKLGLPHTIHLHGNNLGHPGNYEITLETFDIVKKINAATGRKNVLHFTHCQFNAYAGDTWQNFASGAEPIIEYVNTHDHVTIDVGQVIFGDTTTMTADGPWEYALQGINHQKWTNADVELETSSGVVPYEFRRKNPVNAVQWAIGLELLLGIKDPWKICATTDHPNGGPFFKYPTFFSWLMSKVARKDMLEKVHDTASKRSKLPDFDREYTFGELAVVTRATTAKLLGLKNKGHLGVGADGDVAIYNFDPEKMNPSTDYKKLEKALGNAAYTIKDGLVVVKGGKVVASPFGKTFWVDAHLPKEQEASILDDLRYRFTYQYSVNFRNYAVQMEYLPKSMAITVGNSN